MRSQGNTISGGPTYSGYPAPDLPREKRETPEQLRERMEAKVERRKQLSPWNRPPASKSVSRAMGAALVDHDYIEQRFTSPAPVDDPADVDDTTPAEEATVSTPAPHACDHCDRTFATKQGLGGHQRTHRNEAPPQPAAAPEPEAAGPDHAETPPAAPETEPTATDAPAGSDETICEQHGPGHLKGLLCTKRPGHDGDHVAHDGDDHVAGRWTNTPALAAALTEVQSAALAGPPAPEDEARGLADVEELLGALEQYLEELPRGVERTDVLGDVVTTLQMGTAALRGHYRELFGAEIAP